MKASSQVVLIADSPCYDDHTVEVDPVKVCVLFFDTLHTYLHIAIHGWGILHTSGFGLLQPHKTFAGWLWKKEK